MTRRAAIEASLARDPRRPHAELARELGCSAANVRDTIARIRRDQTVGAPPRGRPPVADATARARELVSALAAAGISARAIANSVTIQVSGRGITVHVR